MMLGKADVEQFDKDGYVFPVDILSPEEVAEFRARIEAVEALNDGKLLPKHRAKSFLLFKWLDDLIRDPRVLDPVEQLIGPNILCWNTLFWIKEADNTSFVGWHQDTKYWGLSSDKVVTAWLALSTASVEAGCMKVLPGSHIGDVLEHDERYNKDNMLTRGQELTVDPAAGKTVHMPLAAGQMSLHNYRIAHASGPNNAPDRRIGVSMHFMPPETEQIVGSWDSAALVRGADPYGHFVVAPRPQHDFDPEAVAFHEKASKALSDVLYHGAKSNTGKL